MKMEEKNQNLNENNEWENWQETIFLLEKIKQKIENYHKNSKVEIKPL